MKSFVKSLLGFCSFFIVIYVLLLLFWGKFLPSSVAPNLRYPKAGPGHLFSRLKEVKTIKNVDILFLGSSHTYRGFDNRIFTNAGFSSFNLGSSSQSPLQTEVLLKRYLEALNPKLVVYEVYPITLFSDAVESSIDLLANDQNDVYSVKMALRLNNTLSYNSLIYGFWDNFLDFSPNFESTTKSNDRYINGGFVQSKSLPFVSRLDEAQKLDLSENKVRNFKRNLDLLRKNNISFVLVLAPVSKELYHAISNWSSFHQFMQAQGAYFNFNPNSFEKDSLYFYDSDHMNQIGVEIFNKQLLSKMKSSSLLSSIH